MNDQPTRCRRPPQSLDLHFGDRRWSFLIAAALLLGCGTGKPPDEKPPAEKPPAPISVELSAVGPAELQAAIDAQRGKVVLVDFWATWCTSCVAMLPHVVELQQKHADRGLVVLTVSVDDADAAMLVRAFLEERGIPLRAFISRAGTAQETFEAFQLNAVPTYRLYDRAGKLRHTLPRDGVLVPADIDEAVEQLLAE